VRPGATGLPEPPDAAERTVLYEARVEALSFPGSHAQRRPEKARSRLFEVGRDRVGDQRLCNVRVVASLGRARKNTPSDRDVSTANRSGFGPDGEKPLRSHVSKGVVGLEPEARLGTRFESAHDSPLEVRRMTDDRSRRITEGVSRRHDLFLAKELIAGSIENEFLTDPVLIDHGDSDPGTAGRVDHISDQFSRAATRRRSAVPRASGELQPHLTSDLGSCYSSTTPDCRRAVECCAAWPGR